MLRISVDFAEPGMELGRPLYDSSGRTILSAGMKLTDKHLAGLKKWEIRSLWVNDPAVSLPPVDEVMEEETRLRAVKTVKTTFETTKTTGFFKLTKDQKGMVEDIITKVIRQRLSMIHLAQIQQHDDNLFEHSINVTLLSAMTTVALGNVNSQEMYSVAIGAMLHDIGKVAVSPEILKKHDKLTTEEMEIYEGHTAVGFEILRKTGEIPLMACHIALQHHERVDGRGYPRKIDLGNINRLARIVAIANDYDNLISGRGNVGGMAPHLAYENIVSRANTAFDPEILQAFLSCVAVYPVGSVVKLSSGQIAVVAAVTKKMQHRPELKVIGDEQGNRLPEPFMLNLADQKNLTLFIEEVLDDTTTLAFLRKNR